MIKQVAHPTVSEIFSINSNIVYRIPKYQREYTWGIKDWDALFNDVTENDFGYFLGSYICVNDGSLNGTTLEVIDGQQRFTTIMLLLTALYEKLSALKGQMDEDERTDLVNLRSELANKKQTYTSNGTKKTEYIQRLILQKQNTNDEDFSYVLADKGIITAQKAHPKNFGNRRISKAYKHFGKLIDEEIADVKEENPNISDVGVLFGIVRKFENAIMVGIEVDTNKDAYMLFESLNHRGVPLSALDLIKNTLIASAESRADADNSYEIWKQILANVGQDDYSVQERTGYLGKSFVCYKFRTMKVGASSDQATRVDPRKTRVGDFLRRTSLDELPQFINVFKGEMSVVGPRPHMLAHTEIYTQLVDSYMLRHAVKPGITGWAQVNGYRGLTDELWKMERRVEHDMWYIENWNFFLDLKIIVRTVFNAIHGEQNAF